MHKLFNQFLLIIVATFFLISSTNVFAKAVLNIVPVSTYVNLNLAGTAAISFTVTNDTKHPIDTITIDPNYLSTGNPAGISLINNQCASVKLQPNASCTFQILLLDGIVQPALFVLRPRVCGYNGAVCSTPIQSNEVQVRATPRTAFITNFGNNTVSTCLVNSDGTLSTCVQLQDSTFNGPTSTAFNAAATFLYVANFNNNTVSVCPVNVNGVLAPCTAVADPSFNGPNSIASNVQGTFAYVANYNNNTVSICPIMTGGILGSCMVSAQPFFAPNTIKLNLAGTFAYVTNHANNTVAVCSINSNGTFVTCNSSNPGATFNGPTGISLNLKGTFAYLSNSNNVGGNRNISICPINPDGSLGTCTAYISTLFNFNNFGKIAVNSEGTFVYVVNQINGYITLCSINADGYVGSCSQLFPDGTFDSPQGIAVN